MKIPFALLAATCFLVVPLEAGVPGGDLKRDLLVGGRRYPVAASHPVRYRDYGN